ncbi:AAA family ATPase [Sorangium cellulosum]|uniref:AAA family ATPase n=1 Tax=Sorangium cellulosum TaxID=56 RepID=A0A150NZB0_SORCE|nr:AAA family ATPase [Sorangium cellulosum]
MDPVNERDLFKQLLELGIQDEVEPFLGEALSLIVSMTGARRGYIELSGSGSAEGRPSGGGVDACSRTTPRFWMAHGCSETEIEKIREAFSRGIIGDALATGKTILTSCAMEDPRYRERGSVRRNRIEAVLCAPIGLAPPLGVLYLQDRGQPGPFSEDDRSRAEMFTRYLTAFADRLLIRRRRLDDTDPTLPFRGKLRAEEVVGRSRALALLLKDVSLAAPVKFTVLLLGPTGTGKTQIAHVIHASGPRATKPFMPVNCASMPDGLFENELFGAVQGGHSGGRVEGKVTAAQGGTLFLDEVAELSLGAQGKLLQFLQSKHYFPLGSARPMTADVRIIAATNVDLEEHVKQGKFRDDLLSRLEGMTIRVPSLAERREDIVDIAIFFCQRICEENGLPRLKLSVGALCALETAEWPKNIRQLSNAIQQAAIRAAGEGVLQIEQRHLFPEMSVGQGSSEKSLTLQAAKRRFEEQFIRRTLEETGWNHAEAARRLDVSRSQLYNLIKAYKIERPKP